MKIGWIGTGIMGVPMCTHLINEGHDLHVFNRTKGKAYKLIRKGAIWCYDFKELAKVSEVIFLMVGTPKDVAEVILSPNGILTTAKVGTTIVDMTTSSPEMAKKIHSQASSLGIFTLDAPVSGGEVGAKNKTLTIMVGGDRSVFDKKRDLLKTFAENIKYVGGPGSGQHVKMSNQILVAGTMIGVVEALLYACKMKMDLNKVIDVIGKGAASSWSINVLGRKISKRDFKAGFFIKHFVKDMGIALVEAERVNLSLPGLALARQFYILAMSKGYENLGTQGLYKVLEEINSNLKL